MDLAMILALIRPGKRHLIDLCRRRGFSAIASEIWEPTSDGTYWFKAAHGIAYATLVAVHANLLVELCTEDAMLAQTRMETNDDQQAAEAHG
jgi:hypothetical protein